MPVDPNAGPLVAEPGATAREQTRRRIIDVAIDLLERGGRDAVTTRAVADAAGLQPPALYRLFGDKEGLLDAVAERGFSRFLASKHIDPDPQDPLKELRAGWDTAVEFGLANPALYTLMYGEPVRSAVFHIGLELLRERIRRLAVAGRLRVEEDLAAQIIHATARGAVLTWLSLPESERDPALLVALREAMIAAVTDQVPAVREEGPAGAARALRAALPDQDLLSHAERQLMVEWLGRLSTEPPRGRTGSTDRGSTDRVRD
ncbi:MULTISPECIES: TetR/AcrR family transcriptional regulator [unclassified Streptomyces]|uniref:TetR/AcrR family transcriptional regulator n=1 Tax=unclassified Streptomyces TaxID=2593676 RepID=UPI001F03839B|nr:MULTISPECIES: TetR/AcrR family transcriptional regulator [unclassified Streptomyces]MCH0564136.1 TetR/AcrR family transcriptional regulator [Streptomyces sp. MUM 2J]MCH0568439.1 TetR/AcrR family transcriptional regulator [Streptomyces sp. MUM 136J]